MLAGDGFRIPNNIVYAEVNFLAGDNGNESDRIGHPVPQIQTPGAVRFLASRDDTNFGVLIE